MPPDPLPAALELLTLGMGAVLLFLTLLIVATQLMSRIVRRFEAPVAAPPPSGPPAPSIHVDEDTRRAIELAVQRYRQRR